MGRSFYSFVADISIPYPLVPVPSHVSFSFWDYNLWVSLFCIVIQVLFVWFLSCLFLDSFLRPFLRRHYSLPEALEAKHLRWQHVLV